MSVNLQRRPFSMPEFLGGGVALATVALIALGGLRLAPSPNALPAPAGYASVSIQSADALATPPREQPRKSSNVAEAARDTQSADAGPGTGKSTLIDSEGANSDTIKAPHSSAADRPAPPSDDWPAGLHIRQHGSLYAFADAIWGPPVSNPLRNSRIANSQLHDVRAPPRLRTDPTFIGSWTDGTGRCPTGRKAPLAISSRAAKTANGECDFGSVAREAANRWRVTAICTADGNFWRANIALKLSEPNLTWSSERGTDTYVRCDRRSPIQQNADERIVRLSRHAKAVPAIKTRAQVPANPPRSGLAL
jgi:hypothetical protein